MLRLKPQFTNQWMTSRFHLLSTVSVLHSISTQLEDSRFSYLVLLSKCDLQVITKYNSEGS